MLQTSLITAKTASDTPSANPQIALKRKPHPLLIPNPPPLGNLLNIALGLFQQPPGRFQPQHFNREVVVVEVLGDSLVIIRNN